MTHVVPQNLLGNPGSDYIRDQVFSKRAASGLLDAGGMSLVQITTLLPHMPRMDKVQAGTNITVTWNALGPVVGVSATTSAFTALHGDGAWRSPSVPTLIPSGATYAVDADTQILWADDIDVEGTLDVSGRFIEVN